MRHQHFLSAAALVVVSTNVESFAPSLRRARGSHVFSLAVSSSNADIVTTTSTCTSTNDNDDEVLLKYQSEVAGPIASSFVPNQFEPVPWLSNRHVQTVGSHFLRDIHECAHVPKNAGGRLALLSSLLQLPLRNTANKNDDSFVWKSRERIDTPDGDWFHVDYSYDYSIHNKNNNKPLVILLHGLESNSQSKNCMDMARAYQHVGMDVACINFRGCSGVPNDSIGGYHLGFTQDVLQFLEILKQRHSSVPIYLSGFSLGANVVLKALGELGMDAVDSYNIRGATALCAPLDAERNAPFLGASGFNQVVYCENLLKSLRQRAQKQLERHCEGDPDTTMFDYHGVMAAKTITDFDEAFIAPIYGFESAIDYYRKTSAVYFLNKIAVPTLILNARDDPFMDPNQHVVVEDGHAPIQLVTTDNGGHLGYMFHQLSENESPPETTWASHELARFVQHVDIQYSESNVQAYHD